uniref:Uncharacterized protein n=1 Tax=Cacopsylla melanoneura TaxID=428564 RepID=A0A8D8UD13_9HEMI
MTYTPVQGYPDNLPCRGGSSVGPLCCIIDTCCSYRIDASCAIVSNVGSSPLSCGTGKRNIYNRRLVYGQDQLCSGYTDSMLNCMVCLGDELRSVYSHHLVSFVCGSDYTPVVSWVRVYTRHFCS